MRRFVLGVTGAVGAGKSTVCRVLAQRGFAVLDVDDVAAEALGELLPELAQRVPAAVSDSRTLNKAPLFAAMLQDAGLRKELEALLQPFVVRRIRAWVESLRGPGALDAALLFESGLEAFCDATLCVECDRAERRRRVQQRTTASAAHFDALEAAQLPAAEKRGRASAAISTQGPQAHLEETLLAALAALPQPR